MAVNAEYPIAVGHAPELPEHTKLAEHSEYTDYADHAEYCEYGGHADEPGGHSELADDAATAARRDGFRIRSDASGIV